jgi:Peptidase C10 family/Spi protease inhibitor
MRMEPFCEFYILYGRENLILVPNTNRRLKKVLPILSMLVCCFGYSHTIAPEQARAIAWAFFQTHTSRTDTPVVMTTRLSKTTGSPLLYVFAFADSGFVMVSGNDIAKPILAWSGESRFDTTDIPPACKSHLANLEAQIERATAAGFPGTAAARSQWQAFAVGPSADRPTGVTSVNPLVAAKWNQGRYYNQDCPYDPTAKTNVLTGCVATAMGQLMKYWQWPAVGIGNHAYVAAPYGTLGVDFGANPIQWNLMPNALASANPYVAALLYEAGVAVNMEYGVKTSASYVLEAGCPIPENAQNALSTYFGYSSTIQGVQRSGYTDAAWRQLLESELDAGRPVIYNGANDTEGHSFIADGYDDVGNIHFNWGWGGAYNGYFSIDSIIPDSLNFMQGNTALIHIVPDSERVMVMGDSMTTDKKVDASDTFTVTARATYINPGTFTGTLSLTLASSYYPGKEYTQQSEPVSLTVGDSLTVAFHFPGLLPGTYTATLAYQAASGKSGQVAASPTFANNTPIDVYGNPSVDHISVSPNPTTDYIYADLNNASAEYYRLTDAAGRTCVSGTLSATTPLIAIPTYGLTDGVYVLEVGTDRGRQYAKVVVGK